MNSETTHSQAILDQWQKYGIQVNPGTQSIGVNGQINKVEPLVMELLELLLTQPNKVVQKEHILDTLWQGKYVNDEALTKLVSKLRKALADDPKNPKFIKTVPKKGYLLICEQTDNQAKSPFNPRVLLVCIIAIVLVGLLTALYQATTSGSQDESPVDNLDIMYDRAESHYYQYSRLENESAIRLYEKIIAQDSNHALSQSGLANALVQKTLRWPHDILSDDHKHVSLEQSIASGNLDSESAQAQLKRAEGLAERAVNQAPNNAKAHRSLGLVFAAQQKFDLAQEQYLQAIELDPNEWGAMINLSEILSIKGQATESLDILMQAYQAMTINYTLDEVIIRPWYTKLAVLIAQKHMQLENVSEAEIWFRKAMDFDPYHKPAILGLMSILNESGNNDAAEALCFEIKQKIDPNEPCLTTQ